MPGVFKLPIEFQIILFFFGALLCESVYTNFIIYRTCYVTLGYNKTECALLGSSKKDNKTAKLEEIVEPYAAVINMVRSVIEAGASAILCLFFAPWSDKFGRKPLILLPCLGFSLTLLMVTVFSALELLSPWYSLLCSIPVVLSGGGSTYVTGVLSHITDISAEENRGFRMGLFEVALGIGVFLGNISSSYLLASTGYTAFFGIACSMFFVCFIINLFCLEESLQSRQQEGRLSEFFQISNLLDNIKTSLRQRPNHNRQIVLLCIALLSLYMFVINSDSSVIFLYLREKFHWSLRKYTLYNSAHNCAYILGTLASIYFLHKLLKIEETVLILCGYISLVNSSLIQGLGTKDWHIYAGSMVRCVSGVISPMVRSIVTKVVPTEEIGKVFSVIVTMQSLVGIFGPTVYTIIYNKTISIDPGFFNYITAGIYTLCSVLVSIVMVLRYKDRNYYSELNYIDENYDEECLVNA